MRFARMLIVGSCALCGVMLAGCGDASSFSSKLAAMITRKNNTSLTNRAPEVVAEQFLAAFTEANFQKAKHLCTGDALAFMDFCEANYRLQAPKEKNFWGREFANFATFRMKGILLEKKEIFEIITPDNKKNYCVTLNYYRPPFKEIYLQENRPQVFDIAIGIFPSRMTASPNEKNEDLLKLQRDFVLKQIPECRFQIQLQLDEAKQQWKIFSFNLAAAPGAAQAEENVDYDKQTEDILSKLDEEERAAKEKAAPAKTTGADTNGGENIDFGF